MTLLLDTHVWLWAVEALDKLGRRTKALLLNPTSRIRGAVRFFCGVSR
jgi:PIN domain nuclease of toxin-antitoxin system